MSTPQSAWNALRHYLLPYRRNIMWGCLALLATNLLFLGVPILLRHIVDALTGSVEPASSSLWSSIPVLSCLLIACALVTAITRIASRIGIFHAARDAEHDLRVDLLDKVLQFEPSYFQKHQVGDVMSRLTSDVQTIRAMWGVGILNLINTVVAFVTVLTVMITVDPLLTLWAVLPYPLMVFVGQLFGKHIYRASKGTQEKLGNLSSNVQETLSGIDVIKLYNTHKGRHAKFTHGSKQLLDNNMKLVVVRGRLIPALTAVASLGTLIVLWVGGKHVIEGRTTLGELIEFNALLARLVWPTLALGWMLSLIQRGRASWSRLSSLLAYEPEIVDGKGPALSQPVTGAIEIKNVSMNFDGNVALDRVTVAIPAGAMTAIVGPTGSGKSVLLQIIARGISPSQGTITIDNREITDLPLSSLRQAIAYSPQEAFLFSDTIAANILFAYKGNQTIAGSLTKNKSEQGDKELLNRLTALAGLDTDIARFPKGTDTMVGERGVTLSGGQKQRVALARAVACDAPILILDDSLSSVDARTEQSILQNLREHVSVRTTVVVSHRLAAIQKADQIIVLDKGAIAGVGSHQELMNNCPTYQHLYEQKGAL